jgi:starch synthase
MRVLFLAAEAEPFVKVGGLGDVAGSLPLALRGLPAGELWGEVLDVRLALPFHSSLHASSVHALANYSISRAGRRIPVRAFETRLGDASAGLSASSPVYLISGKPIAAGGAVYSPDPRRDAAKYAFFSMAALELMRQIDWWPDLVHANDWHTALALYAARQMAGLGRLTLAARVLTVHNLSFMGPDVGQQMSAYKLPSVETDLPDWASRLPLPLGLWAADAIVGVSPTYANEMLTAEAGHGLEAFLRTRADSLSGILNGLDVAAYDPAHDPALAFQFGVKTLARRFKNKQVLQERLGLLTGTDLPLLAVVSRMDSQKGIDLVVAALYELAEFSWQAVILGTGDPSLAAQVGRLQAAMPERVRAEDCYDAKLARQIYASADILLMPSRYEPCGLAQMIAMRYGCIPVARATGGLSDTIQPGETGFLFTDATSAALASSIQEAFSSFADRKRWRTMQRAAMRQDFSWARSARVYAALYQKLVAQGVAGRI